MKKKIVKKIKKAVTTKKRPAKKSVPKKPKGAKPIGKVTHFYDKISVAIVKFQKPITVGSRIAFRHGEHDIEQIIDSMQYNHAPITKAKKGQEVGIHVDERVREGFDVFEVKQ